MRSMLSFLLLLLTNTIAGYLIPNPPGKYNVTLTTGPLIDYSRNDPYAATPTPRALMLSVFQPAKCAPITPVPYMPNKTAEYQGPFLQQTFNISIDLTPLFLEARLPVCSDHSSSCTTIDDSPILLFSPGWGIPRLYYSVLASAIASKGFMVITIDHPEDANIITYPDGHAVYLNVSTWDGSTKDDQATPSTWASTLLTEHVAMLGHSLGGASAIIAAGQDSRIRGAINWDGTIFGSLPSSGLSQPVLLMMDAETAIPPDWQAAWPQLKGPKLWVTVANTTHQTFSDFPTLLQAAGQDLTAFADLLGTIAPAEMVRILTAYTTAWMTGAFTGKEEVPSDKFPEISTMMKGNF